MTGGTANRCKYSAAIIDRGGAAGNSGGWRGWGKKLHEPHKQHRVTGARRSVSTIGVSDVLRCRIDAAVGRQSGCSAFTWQRALLGKEFVAHAHLHVVGFAGENEQ